MNASKHKRTAQLSLCILFALTGGTAIAGSVGCPSGGGGSTSSGTKSIVCVIQQLGHCDL